MGTAQPLGGKVALVTGSSRGIGAAVARALDNAGASVVVNSAREVTKGTEVARSLSRGVYVQADISDEKQVRNLVDKTMECFGRLDILVNNAGVTRRIPHRDLAAADRAVWQSILDVNLIGTWLVTVACAPYLRDSGDAAIVNMSSVAGLQVAGSSIPYAVSKAALCHLTKLLASALAPDVRVNAIAPGFIDTEMTSARPTLERHVREESPLRRIGDTEDVATAVLSLLAWKYTTGEIVRVDGGVGLR